MKRTLLILVGILAVTSQASICTGQGLSKSLPILFGKEYEGFQWLDYPLDNYGLGTMYSLAKSSGRSRNTKIKLKDVDFLCDTFICLKISPPPSRPSADVEKPEGDPWYRLAPAGGNLDRDAFAAIGCGSDITDIKDLERKSKVAVTAFLPLILKAVGITANASYEKSVKLSGGLSIGCRRSLYTDKMEQFLRALPADSRTRKSLDDGTLVVIVYDAVVKSLDLTVAPKSALGVKVDMALNGKPAEIFGKDAKVGVEVTKGDSGEYKLKLAKPLIVGFLARQQSRGAGAGGSLFKYNVDTWQPVAVKLPKLMPKE